MVNNNTIMQEMINNHENCRIIEESGEITVKLRPATVAESLVGKLSSEDISKGMTIVNRQNGISNIKTNLYRQCSNTHCIAKDKCVFRAIPNGSSNANVMFLNKMPTQYEMCSMNSHCDKNAVFLSLILDKMQVSRDSVYCTDMIKCNTQLDEQSYHECIHEYIAKEIEYVMPKIIICNGLSVLKACSKTGLFLNLPTDVTYGKIYDTMTSSQTRIKVTAIYDLDIVLQKTEEDYNKCKGELWAQLLSAFKASCES